MSDLISRQAAIDAMNEVYCHIEMVKKRPVNNTQQAVYLDMIGAVKSVPSAQPEQKEPCSACKNLEIGDTLYASSDWDGGVGFDYIRDIKYCPVCGRKLNDG
jgi:hypothetical protein